VHPPAFQSSLASGVAKFKRKVPSQRWLSPATLGSWLHSGGGHHLGTKGREFESRRPDFNRSLRNSARGDGRGKGIAARHRMGSKDEPWMTGIDVHGHAARPGSGEQSLVRPEPAGFLAPDQST
jgi:hypothetical protein